MDAMLSQRIEVLLLTDSRWHPGTRSGENAIGTRRVTNDTLNLSVQEAKPDTRTEAMRLLVEKYGIDAALTQSQSFDRTTPEGTWVIRVEDSGPYKEISKLIALQRLAHVPAWKANLVTSTQNGITREDRALNLLVEKLDDRQKEYLTGLLGKLGIEGKIVQSRSLGNREVLRVIGEDAIDRLGDAIPTLAGFKLTPAPVAARQHSTADTKLIP